mmetsp:Transcript_532/g.768  ORF Transcript_532/g.768 Transcript_532/m.768 type:complete len:106 (+) Transcript_532:152-469(+)
MLFCPTCGNLLVVDRCQTGMRFFCQTCPYIYNISQKVTKKITLKRKEVDDVLGGQAAWDNVDRTMTRCPFCEHNEAYFMQIQIRSADEPMTTFYKCVSCKKQWND